MQDTITTREIKHETDSIKPAAAQKSGLFIRGLKMPENCAECRLKACILFEIKNPNRGCSLPELYEFLNNDHSGRRYDNCPLEEVEIIQQKGDFNE